MTKSFNKIDKLINALTLDKTFKDLLDADPDTDWTVIVQSHPDLKGLWDAVVEHASYLDNSKAPRDTFPPYVNTGTHLLQVALGLIDWTQGWGPGEVWPGLMVANGTADAWTRQHCQEVTYEDWDTWGQPYEDWDTWDQPYED